MRRRTRLHLPTPSHAPDPGYLGDYWLRKLRDDLRPARLAPPDEMEFLAQCGIIAQQFAIEVAASQPPTDTKQKLEALAALAQGLCDALEALPQASSATLHSAAGLLSSPSGQSDRLSQLAERTIAAEGRYVGGTWEVVQDLAYSATYAASLCLVGRAIKPKKILARRLVQQIAFEFRALSGKDAPTSDCGWFAEFMRDLGKAIGLTCGPDVVARGVKTRPSLVIRHRI